jgi:hypothetical protein
LFFHETGGLNSGLCTCKAGTLPLEPRLHSILLWLFWTWGSHELFSQAGLQSQSSWFQSPSQVARIIEVSHQHPTKLDFWDGVFLSGLASKLDPTISISQLAGITSVSHHTLPWNLFIYFWWV